MDRDIAERMRCENFEQFQTLVRMHLSFELDLNTDAVDLEGVHNIKLKSKKLFTFPKKSKHLQSNASRSNNPPFNVVHTLTTFGIEQIKQIIAYLVQDQNIIQEGIFRRTGSVARQNELRRKFHVEIPLNFSDPTYTVHDYASVLKAIIADLPEPILTDTFYVVHCQIAELWSSNHVEPSATKEMRLLHSIQLLLLLLPVENRSLFHDIINMLKNTTRYESSNKMSSESLATLFTPHLICPRKLSPEALHSISQNFSGMISFMITKGEEIQDIPPKLATDIRAYFLEQKRKKVLSPDVQMLNESVTSDSTANTVYTFIDREKTAEAHIMNSTDTALAQLYAYIQTLPESSKKRKLIKQFNKENGQGTPLQQQMLMRLKKGSSTPSTQRSNKSSLSGSIKKHIFHTTLGSKTPRRDPSNVTTATPTATTPVNRAGSEANLSVKPRLVFPKPVQNCISTELLSSTPGIKSPLVETPNSSGIADKELLTPSDIDKDEKIEIDTIDQHLDSDEHQPAERCKINKKDDEEIHHTPTTFNINRFITCFKSEPNLSKMMAEKQDNGAMLNRGRFIAKKLLNGVSMVNLRRPFTSHIDKPEAKLSGDGTPKTSRGTIDAHGDAIEAKKIAFDHAADSENKENNSPNHFNEPQPIDYASKTVVTMSSSIVNDSVSPITKSTHRMSKAMQESIMTPRSRKPVIIGAMLGMAADNYHNKFMNFPINDDEDDFDLDENKDSLLNISLQKSKSESDLLPITSSCSAELLEPDEVEVLKMGNSTSEESLSTPFRKYLISRSLLMTTPLDSSFTSQSDDFENLNDSEMSESLIYCLNGNEPTYLTPCKVLSNTAGRQFSSNGSNSSAKRPHTNIGSSSSDSTESMVDQLYVDYGSVNAKKNHLELDETAL